MPHEAHPELEIVDRDALVGGVDQRAASSASITRNGKKPYATVPKASRNQWLSVNPATQIGAGLASGSTSLIQPAIASQSGVWIGERVPPCASSLSNS